MRNDIMVVVARSAGQEETAAAHARRSSDAWNIQYAVMLCRALPRWVRGNGPHRAALLGVER
jgi:hypothetical protein